MLDLVYNVTFKSEHLLYKFLTSRNHSDSCNGLEIKVNQFEIVSWEPAELRANDLAVKK